MNANVPVAVHSIHFPGSARSFVMPMVEHLNRYGIPTELWFENQEAHRETIRHIAVPQRHLDSDLSAHPVRLARRLANYRTQLRRARPTVVHAHQMRASLIPLLAARLEGVPIRVYHNHGLPYLGYRGAFRWILRRMEQINIGLATHVLLVSHSNLEAARVDRLLPPDRGRVLAHGSAVGIDLAQFSCARFDADAKKTVRERFSIRPNAFVLAYVGRPVKRKGFHRLLSAWEESGLGRKGNVLLVAGCTAEECAGAARHIVEGVRGLGYLTDLMDFYAACDAVVLPSDHEGFGYSLLEGAAAGKALIGSDIPGIRCAIRHNETGLLVRLRDAHALRQAIERLAHDPAVRTRLGCNARARVEKEFSRKILLQSLLEYYKSELLLSCAAD